MKWCLWYSWSSLTKNQLPDGPSDFNFPIVYQPELSLTKLSTPWNSQKSPKIGIISSFKRHLTFQTLTLMKRNEFPLRSISNTQMMAIKSLLWPPTCIIFLNLSKTRTVPWIFSNASHVNKFHLSLNWVIFID